MKNERLRRAMLKASFGPAELAEAIGASEKSVRRWLDGTSIPHPRVRFRVGTAVGEDETYLWPEVSRGSDLAGAELVATWPRRADVPTPLWSDLLKECTRNFDLLAFAGLFLTEEHPQWIPLLQEKLEAGVRIRLLIGDPVGRQVKARDRENRIGGGVDGRVDAVISHYSCLAGRAEIRGHDTPLYNSIYRFDDEMLVNTHVYGILAAYTPVLRLRRVDGRYFDVYRESFDRVWANARPLDLRKLTSERHD